MLEDVTQRDAAIADNRDPFGKKWGVYHVKGTGMYALGLVKGTQIVEVQHKDYPTIKVNGKVNRSEEVSGKWTKPEYAYKTLTSYLVAAWNWSDGKASKNLKPTGFKEATRMGVEDREVVVGGVPDVITSRSSSEGTTVEKVRKEEPL